MSVHYYIWVLNTCGIISFYQSFSGASLKNDLTRVEERINHIDNPLVTKLNYSSF